MVSCREANQEHNNGEVQDRFTPCQTSLMRVTAGECTMRTKNVGRFPVYCAEGGSRKQIGAMEWKGSDELYLAGKARVSTFRPNYNPSHHQVWPRWWGVLWRQLSAGVRGSDCDVTGRVVKNTDLVQRSKECTRHQAKENDSESVMRQNMLLGFLPGLAGSMLFLWCLCGSD